MWALIIRVFTYRGCSRHEDKKLLILEITVPYLHRALGRAEEALKAMGSDIRREKGAEKPLYFPVQIKVRCSVRPIPFRPQRLEA
jgi:hypothetical protein